MSHWATDKLDVDYIVKSGLLFKINQTVTHLFGVGFGVSTNSAGEKQFTLIDSRAEPEKMIFSESAFEMGENKYAHFRDEYGGSQLNRRRDKLGIGCQNYPVVNQR